jgi:hypothetical protein
MRVQYTQFSSMNQWLRIQPSNCCSSTSSSVLFTLHQNETCAFNSTTLMCTSGIFTWRSFNVQYTTMDRHSFHYPCWTSSDWRGCRDRHCVRYWLNILLISDIQHPNLWLNMDMGLNIDRHIWKTNVWYQILYNSIDGQVHLVRWQTDNIHLFRYQQTDKR